MIRKLRVRLIGITMLSLALVMLLLIGILNVVNYLGIVNSADEMLSMLHDSGIRFLDSELRFNWRDANPRFRSPELPFELRFFTAIVGDSGELRAVNVERIAAVDEAQVSEYARRITMSGRERGFVDDYRYMVYDAADGARGIIFLDCGRMLAGQRQVLLISVLMSLASYALVVLLVVLLSRRIVRPFIENYEKQRRFITDAGHELKTPLTIIDADAEVLAMELEDGDSTGDGSGGNEWLADIRAQSRRLAALTNELIALSRMEEDGRAQMIEFPLSDVVSETAASFQAPARTQGKRFEVHVQPLISYTGDEKAISQLVSILLDNALKYSSPDGNIALTLEKKGKNILLCVENAVDEMPQQTLENMFERFYRGDSSHSSETSGHGLGLSIARAIVNAHRGRISATLRDEHTLVISVVLGG